jgi:hypothetical protein
MWDRRTLERELAELGVREFEAEVDAGIDPYGETTADVSDLREYQGSVDPTVRKIDVKDWIKSLNVVSVKLTAAATPDDAAIQASEKISPLPFDRPVRMWIRAGELERVRRGEVSLDLKVEYEGFQKIPRSSKVARARFKVPTLKLSFTCTAEGAIRLERNPSRRTTSWSDDLGIDVEVYQRKDRPKNSPMRGIPPAVWSDWMSQFCIFRLVIIIKLTVTDGKGWYTIDFKHGSVPIPDRITAGSTGPRTAVLGPMTIDLVPEGARPPITAKQGIMSDVYFAVDSHQLDRAVDEGGRAGRVHQGNKLDAWIRNDMIARWDVREALLRGDLPIRGEARASATLKGRGRPELLRYNRTLSEKRRDAVVNRLKKTLTQLDRDIKLDPTQVQIQAIGASQAPVFGEENALERRCRIRIDAVDLDAAIRKLYKERHRWWWER